MDVVGVVLAADGGRSPDSAVPMALRLLDDVPLVVHAVRALSASGVVDHVVVVAPPGAADRLRDQLTGLSAVVVDGVGSRHGSLHCGLSALGFAAEVVVVHDACRPLAPAELVVRAVAAVRAGADLAVPVLEVTETVKELDASGWIIRTVPRETLVRVQTPQAARRAVLDAAHRGCAPDPGDGADRVAGDGARAVAVAGHDDAFPVLREHDLDLAAAVLAGRRALPRPTGYPAGASSRSASTRSCR